MPNPDRSNVDSLLCRWAEKKYGLHAVEKVDFEFRDDGDWSEVTPGDGPYMAVVVTYRTAKSGEQTYTKQMDEAHYDTALIREILAFGVSHAE